MLTATRVVLVLMLAATGEVRAHGIHETVPGTAAPAEFHVIPRAHAAITIRIEEREGYRVFEADGVPDHATGNFPNSGNPNRMSPQRYRMRVPLRPEAGPQITPLPRGLFGIALNGVMFDPSTAEFWNNDPRSGWNYDALSGRINLGIDRNNAHVQPTGAYHYHGIPTGLIARLAQPGRPVMIGYSADGFPMYGPQGYRLASDPASPLVDLRPSWRLREGSRPGGFGGPGGRFDGSFNEDYEYVEGHGDLDRCNGRTGVTAEYPNGTYYYVVTATFPFVPRCFIGTPDASFRQGPVHGGPGEGRPGGGPPPPRPPARPGMRLSDPADPSARPAARTSALRTSTGRARSSSLQSGRLQPTRIKAAHA